MIKSNCKFCGKEVITNGRVARVFCNIKCKADWQRTQKPATKEWLYQKYIVEKLSANDIAKIVHCDPKQVWRWIRDYGIETRKRGYANPEVQFKKGQPSYWTGKKHNDEFKEKIRQARYRDGRKPYLVNGVHYLKGKKGKETPNWKGGITPERQKVYGTLQWKSAIKLVWKRDAGICQRCKRKATTEDKRNKKFDVHHIVSFENIQLRTEVSNLVLLCEECHYFVHSRKNEKGEFVKNG